MRCCEKSDLPNIFDTETHPDGPVCHCGAPSEFESGVCFDCRWPKISCVMPTTAKRRWCIERSIRCWQRQSYPNRELLIVGDGPESVEDLVAPFTETDKRIRYVHLDGERTLGMKYNACIELVNGPYIALWADDDWHHPDRLQVVANVMCSEAVEVAGTNTMLCHRTRDKQDFMYWSPPIRPFIIGGTLIFARKLWAEKTQFPNMASASDTAFVMYLLWPQFEGEEHQTRYSIVGDPRLYVAFVHGDNTGNNVDTKEDRPVWVKLDAGEVNYKKLMGEDVAKEFGL